MEAKPSWLMSPGASRSKSHKFLARFFLHQGARCFLTRQSEGPQAKSGTACHQSRATAAAGREGPRRAPAPTDNREAQRRWVTCTGSHSKEVLELDEVGTWKSMERSSPGPSGQAPSPGAETGDAQGPTEHCLVMGQNKQRPCGAGAAERSPPARPGSPGTGARNYLQKVLCVCQNAADEDTGGK